VPAAIYFAPSFVAAYRNSANRIGVFFLNLFLGWTIIGWIAALLWAFTSPSKAV
jgi:hypothetical protein